MNSGTSTCGQESVRVVRLVGSRVARRPLERVVGHLLPARDTTGEARPTRGLMDGSRGFGVAVLLLVRSLYRRRHQVVLAAGDEQQRSTLIQVVVHPGLLVARLEVGDQAVGPDPVARRRNVEPVVGRVGLFPGEGV